MRRYHVTFRSRVQYLFWAEDEAHAREQAEDAEPSEVVDTIVDTGVTWCPDAPLGEHESNCARWGDDLCIWCKEAFPQTGG